ncbi:hypothetical protein O0L34_g1660 [Tuta absoluta]|nr:hypothetical protein O0L34_g1660 [Tuta absoluta]
MADLLLFRFFDTRTHPVIFLFINSAGKLSCSLVLPADNKNKFVCCIRNQEEKITVNNFHKMISLCEMSSDALLDICLLSNEVFCPMLCNPQNQKDWPNIIKHDIIKHIDHLRSLMHLVRGDLTTEVVLPMPTGVEDCDFMESQEYLTNIDVQLKTNIEGAVIKWARQIYDFLQQDSYTAGCKQQKKSLPLDEINFYQQRLVNLEGIYMQLRDPRVRRMVLYLEKANSVYMDCFKTLLINVVTAIVECRDICVYQSPLVKHFKNFEATDFFEAKPLISVMLHCVGLLWSQCRHFCYVKKLIPLLQKICNLVIKQCTSSIDPPTIFKGKPDEQLLKIREALSMLKYFMQTFEFVRSEVPSLFPLGVKPVCWAFDFEPVFARLSVYIERLYMIEDILESAVEIFNLEKVQFSSNKGKILTNECLQIMEKYLLDYQNLGSISYNPADPEDNRFCVDYENHVKNLKDIDNQLASPFTQALDECQHLEDIFKFLKVIGDLIHHPIIKAELQPKLQKLLDLMLNNLDAVKDICDEEKQNSKEGYDLERRIVNSHLPPVASMLWWISQLRQRITVPMDEFLNIEDLIIETESVMHMKKKHRDIMGNLNALEDKLFLEWIEAIPKICRENLSKNLIYQDPLFIRHNFSPELMMLLREIKYMKLLNKQGVPLQGLELYTRNEELQTNLSVLNCSIDWYNAICKDSHETEIALVEKEINVINQLLHRGVKELTWNDDFTEWISRVYTATNDLQQRVLTAQSNIRRGLFDIAAWADEPLYNTENLLDFSKIHDNLVVRRKKILESHKEFQDILKDNSKLFFNLEDEDNDKEEEVPLNEADEEIVDDDLKAMHFSKLQEIENWRIQNQLEAQERQHIGIQSEAIKRLCRKACKFQKMEESTALVNQEVDLPVMNGTAISKPARQVEVDVEQWSKYVKNVDRLVSSQIMKAIKNNLELLELQMNVKMGPGIPVINVIAELRDPDIHLSPSLDINEPDGLYNMLNEMMKDIFLQAKYFPRIDHEVVPLLSYEDDVVNETAITKMYNGILRRIESSIANIIDYVSKYEKFAHLWQKDRQDVLQVFKKFGKYISPEEIAKYELENGTEPPEQKPTLEDYQKEVENCIAMYEGVVALPTSYLANGWLNLDLTRLNQAIMNIICKWSNLYKMDLKEQVHARLENLEAFINHAFEALAVELVEGDYDGLLRVMGMLNDVHSKVDIGTDEIVKPIRDIIDLLEEYEVELSEETYEQLDRVPEKWCSLVKQATKMEHTIAPLKTARASLVAKRCSQVNQRLATYREQFRNKEMFQISCREPYTQMDQVYRELIDMESHIQNLKHSCSLFEVQTPDEKCLIACRSELKLIKQLWDYYFLVMGTIDSWKALPWMKMDIDAMNEECKSFTKDLRKLDKDVKSWEPYAVIDVTIKNLMTCLRSAKDMQEPILKDEQWLGLMKVTKTVHNHLLSIDTPHVPSKPSTSRHPSNISVQEIISDFKSLDDLDSTAEPESSYCGGSKTSSMDVVTSSYKKYLHLQDYRRLKSFENPQSGTKFKKLNRTYSLQEMKEHGLQLQPSRKKPCHQKSIDQALILSEFIM